MEYIKRYKKMLLNIIKTFTSIISFKRAANWPRLNWPRIGSDPQK